MTLGMESPHAGQELAILEPPVDASLRNNTKVVENLMRYASPSVATGVAVFGLGVAALPLISGCRPERDDSVDEAAELFTAEELRVRIGPLAPARLSAEMQLEVLDVVQHASVASQDDLKAEVEALQAWSDVTAPALSSLERRSALAYLGLGLDAEPEAVHRSYKQKALAVHPDKGGSVEDFLNLQEMVGRLQEADVKIEEKGKTGNLYETMREMMKRAKEAREQKDTCQEQHVPEEIRLQHRRTALHEQTIRFWERAKTAELQLNEGYGTKSQNASILAQLHHLVDDLATGIKSLPQGIAAATAGERLLCRLLRRGVDILAASSLVDATATVAHVSLSFVGPLLETVRDCGPCPRLELRCRLLLRALAEVPAAFENFMKTVGEGLENKAAAEWKGCHDAVSRPKTTQDRPQESHPVVDEDMPDSDIGQRRSGCSGADVAQDWIETYIPPESQALQLQTCYTDTAEWRSIRALCVRTRFCVDFNRDGNDERCTDSKCGFKHGCAICGEMQKGSRRLVHKYHGAWNCPLLPGWLAEHRPA